MSSKLHSAFFCRLKMTQFYLCPPTSTFFLESRFKFVFPFLLLVVLLLFLLRNFFLIYLLFLFWLPHPCTDPNISIFNLELFPSCAPLFLPFSGIMGWDDWEKKKRRREEIFVDLKTPFLKEQFLSLKINTKRWRGLVVFRSFSKSLNPLDFKHSIFILLVRGKILWQNFITLMPLQSWLPDLTPRLLSLACPSFGQSARRSRNTTSGQIDWCSDWAEPITSFQFSSTDMTTPLASSSWPWEEKRGWSSEVCLVSSWALRRAKLPGKLLPAHVGDSLPRCITSRNASFQPAIFFLVQLCGRSILAREPESRFYEDYWN